MELKKNLDAGKVFKIEEMRFSKSTGEKIHVYHPRRGCCKIDYDFFVNFYNAAKNENKKIEIL
jgi:hypothetical protein